MKQATGDFWLFLDDDDVVLETDFTENSLAAYAPSITRE